MHLECRDGVAEGGLAAVQMPREAMLQAAEALSWRIWVCHLPRLLIKAAKSPVSIMRSLPLEGAANHQDRWDQANASHQILTSPRICVVQTQIRKPRSKG